MWTIPCRLSFTSNNWMPNSLQLFLSVSTCSLDSLSEIPFDLSVVGILWSGTAKVNSGLLTFLLCILSPSKACGLVTSCIKCLSTYNNVVPSCCKSTRWSSHILSYSVLDIWEFYLISLFSNWFLSRIGSFVILIVFAETVFLTFFFIFSAILADLPFLSLK